MDWGNGCPVWVAIIFSPISHSMKRFLSLAIAVALMTGCTHHTISVPDANQGGTYEVRVTKRTYIPPPDTLDRK